MSKHPPLAHFRHFRSWEIQVVVVLIAVGRSLIFGRTNLHADRIGSLYALLRTF